MEYCPDMELLDSDMLSWYIMNLTELKSLNDFADRTVLVTGVAGLLGSEIACALIGLNANVVLRVRDQELTRKAVERFLKMAEIMVWLK